MNKNTLVRIFPNASPSFIAANISDDSGKTAQSQCDSVHGTLAKTKGKASAAGRVLVSIVSVRKRLIDPDNVFCKWTIDCLRYVRVLAGDEQDKISLKVHQRKCEEGEEEHTELTLIPL